MATSTWRQRRRRLEALLDPSKPQSRYFSENEFATRLNDVLDQPGHNELEGLLFSNKDVVTLGRLANGQFGVVDLVRCKLDGKVYARKTLSKSFAYRAREQCFVQNERDLLLAALETRTPWAPHLVCAYQTHIELCLMMQFSDGGTLWDLLEFSGAGRISETDARWWIPQAVSAVDWCHKQGFVHRDIKPHNFVITSSSHLHLIDFGSSAPLLQPSSSGVQRIPKSLCLVPCGTCDYISPEILEMHEAALVAAELGASLGKKGAEEEHGYGRETDWWSFGAMVYEMVYGVAPFFADDVKQTYVKIVEHEKHLRFDEAIRISPELQDLLRRMLTGSRARIGRHGVQEIQRHPFFQDVQWSSLHFLRPPEGLLLPHFTYTEEERRPSEADVQNQSWESSLSFSELVDSAVTEDEVSGRFSGQTARQRSPFARFSWGPPMDAFNDVESPQAQASTSIKLTPRFLKTRQDSSSVPASARKRARPPDTFVTPLRPSPSLPPVSGTIRRTRPMSDRQALKQMIGCVGASAHKKVLESGKKPSAERRQRPTVTLATDMADISVDTASAGPPSPSPRPGSSLSRAMASGVLRGPGALTARSRSNSGNVLLVRAAEDRWDGLESRHRKLMGDIERAEEKLQALKVRVGEE